MTTAPVLATPLPRTEPPAYAEPQPQRHLRLVPQLSIDDIDRPAPITARDWAGSRNNDPLRDAVKAVAGGFFTAVAEVMVGRRSVDQLSSAATLSVVQWLRTLAPHRSASGAPAAAPRVRAVHVCQVNSEIVEATAVIQHGPHVRAMNSRFVLLHRTWQCVALQLV